MLALILLNLNSCILLGAYAVNSAAEYSDNYPYSVSKVYAVVLDKVQRDDITITKNVFTNDKAVIDADIKSKKYSGSFEVTISKIANNSSTLTIKYDIFGDKSKSKEFLKDVKRTLDS
jgi:hypothetical protein